MLTEQATRSSECLGHAVQKILGTEMWGNVNNKPGKVAGAKIYRSVEPCE